MRKKPKKRNTITLRELAKRLRCSTWEALQRIRRAPPRDFQLWGHWDGHDLVLDRRELNLLGLS